MTDNQPTHPGKMSCSEEAKFCVLRFIVCCIIVCSFGGVLVALIVQKAEFDRCNKSPFRPSFNEVTWEDAKAMCVSTYGETYSLATVETAKDVENLFITLEDMRDIPFWIGAVYDEVNQNFFWDGRNKSVDRIAISALWDVGHPGKQENSTRLVILRESERSTDAPVRPNVDKQFLSENQEGHSSVQSPESLNVTQPPPPVRSPVLQAHHKDMKQRYLCRVIKEQDPCNLIRKEKDTK